MAVINNNQQSKSYDDETLRKLHKLELMILKDFIELCEEYNIKYYASYGTLLGAIRHKGFIPWDDDIDLMMFRKDYDNLLKVIYENLDEKYEFFSIEYTDNYYKLHSKLNLKGTRAPQFWEINTDFHQGINIDIFILDNVPNNSLKKKFFLRKRSFYKMMGWFFEISNSDVYASKNKERIGRVIKKILNLFKINKNFLIRQQQKLKNENIITNEVCDFTEPFVLPKDIFDPPVKVKFENIDINAPNDYDTYLKIVYGDYMKLPPENQRINHALEIDFGEYDDV